MNSTIGDRDVIAVVRLLDEAAEHNRRAKQGQPQHAHGLYRRKDQALAEALTRGPEQFVVDSVEAGEPVTLGISHRCTARRFHVRPALMPEAVQRILAALPRMPGVTPETTVDVGPAPKEAEHVIS